MIRNQILPMQSTARQHSLISLAVKRVFDILVSAILLILLSPLFLLIAIAIKRDTPGPVFYRGQRVGKGGKPFYILKFRTMFESSESYDGPPVTAQDDPRITPLGRWLRDTKLNESPQFWNVLRGDMSLVGPRPEDPTLAKTWPLGARNEILSVRPGITSPASVLYHDEESLLSSKNLLERYLKDLTPDKMRLDQLYIRYHSFWLDFDVLLWTALIMVPRIGSYLPPEELLFLGPVSRFFKRYMDWFFRDILVTALFTGFVGLIWHIFSQPDFGWTRALSLTLSSTLIFSIIGALGGVNRINWDKAVNSDAYALIIPWLTSTIIALWANFTFQIMPIGMLLAVSALSLAGFIAARFHKRWTSDLSFSLKRFLGISHAARERVLIVGSGRTAEHMAWILNRPAYAAQFRVVGFIDEDLTAQGMRIYGARIIGTFKDLPQLIKDLDVGLVILADHRINYRDFVSITGVKSNPFLRVLVSPDLYGSMNFLAPAHNDDLDGEESDLGEDDLPCSQCLVRQSLRERKPDG